MKGKKFAKNRLKQKLEQGEIVFGPFVRMNCPAIMEILGYAGFDFAIVDLEHSAMSYMEAESMVRASCLSEITAIIRVPENKDTEILKALDLGAGGVQIPQINDDTAALYASRVSRYYPSGNRGVCKFVRSANYSACENYFNDANKEILVVIQIEGRKGLEKLNDILIIEGIDVVFLGPYDLSQSLGIPGKVNDLRVVEAMSKAVDKIRAAGKVAGIFATDVNDALKWADRGVQYISFGIDTGIVYHFACELVSQLKKKVQ